jgi:hypothetical protein
VGTIDIDPGDPLLERADEAVGALFDASLSRPFAIKESAPQHKIRRPLKKRRG